MSTQLPTRPNLEHLKTQAKDLLNSFRNGNDHARVNAWFSDRREISLSDAQLVVAREYGFESWPKLKAFVDLQLVDPAGRDRADLIARQFVTNQFEEAEALLAATPSLANMSLAAACVTGSLETVRAHLDAKPSLLGEPLAPNDWEPLLYVCFSRLLQKTQFKDGLVETARLMLDRGANARAFWLAGDAGETCLYGATGVNGCPELAELLLQAGADPNDEESFYHSSELSDPECMRLILTYGGDIGKSRNAFGRLFDFERPDMLRAVLDNTPDRSTLPPVIPHAIRRGRSTEMMRILIESGVDLNSKSVSGLTPFQAAVRMGRIDVSELLEANGADTTSSEADKLVGQITLGQPVDRSSVKPEWIKELDAERSPQLCIWSANGNNSAIEALLQLGGNVDAKDENGWTALIEASLRGGLETVRLLLRYGASPTIIEHAHQAHAIGFACHGSMTNKSVPPEDYVQIVVELIDHGGIMPTKVWGSPEVQALLVERGCSPSEA